MRSKTMRQLVAAMGVGLAALAASGGALADDRSRRADATLEGRVEEDLRKDDRLAERVDARVKAGKVTLVGSVETEADKVRAEQLARTRGAKQVDNQLSVAGTGDRNRDRQNDPAVSPQAADQSGVVRPLSDPHRRDPMVGSMPGEQTGSRELRLRTLGMEDPRVARQREEARKQQQEQQEQQRQQAEQQQQQQQPAAKSPRHE